MLCDIIHNSNYSSFIITPTISFLCVCFPFTLFLKCLLQSVLTTLNVPIRDNLLNCLYSAADEPIGSHVSRGQQTPPPQIPDNFYRLNFTETQLFRHFYQLWAYVDFKAIIWPFLPQCANFPIQCNPGHVYITKYWVLTQW